MVPVMDQNSEKLSGLPSLTRALSAVSVGHRGGKSVWEELCREKRVLYKKGVIIPIVRETTRNIYLPYAQ